MPQAALGGQLPVDVPRTCYASDTTTLQQCVTRLRKTDLGQDAIDANKNPLIKVANTRKVIVRDLFLDESTLETSSGECSIGISDSSNVLVDSVLIKGSKFCGVGVVAGSNVVLRNSEIRAAQVYAVWTSPTYLSDGLRIENNTLTGTWSNGIMYSGINGWLTGNPLVNNHNRTVFGHSGGQLVVEKGADQLVISGNSISGGLMAGGYAASGVEFAPNGIYNVDISANRIFDNDGYAFVINDNDQPGPRQMGGITVHNNYFSNNAFGEVHYTGDYAPAVTNNCTGSDLSCLPPTPTGSFLNTASTCTTSSDTCTITINWSTSNASDTQVLVGIDRALFSSNPAGSQQAPWITHPGGWFELYSGKRLLATKWVRAVPQ